MKDNVNQAKDSDSDDFLDEPTKSQATKKWMAMVIVLIMVIAGLSVAYFMKGNVPGAPATPSAVAGSNAVTGQPFNVTINTGSAFQSVDVYFGDGVMVNLPYSGNNTVTAHHTYTAPGTGYVYYVVHYTNGATYTSSNSLMKVSVTPSSTYLSTDQSLGLIAYNTSASSTALVSGQTIFSTGSYVNMSVGYYNEPANKAYSVVAQSVQVSTGQNFNVPYTWTSGKTTYAEASNYALNLTFGTDGLYVVSVDTYTAQVNASTGDYSSNGVMMSTSFFDIAVFANGNVASSTSSGTFVNAESETGSYRTLDPAIAFDSVSLQIIHNVYQQLVKYNGSSTSSFVPELASQLPTVANGGINDNYANYTVTYTNLAGHKVTYPVNIMPYENYTFTIRANATWQDGTPVTAWDAMYSFTRALLFVDSVPGTGAWIVAQYMLPGDYRHTASFENITQNMTVDNATNSITLHFQHPMSPSLVFQILTASSGFYVMDANWLAAHGAGITWNATGFEAYKAEGNQANYNTYVQNNVMADGPYKISYIVPSTEVVMTANPQFNAPGPWFPKPSIKTVELEYIGETSTIYLQLKSGQATTGGIPGGQWYLVQNLEKAGLVKTYSFASLSIFWYNFNANINTTGVQGLYSGSNVPSQLFTSLDARKAFAYAYNYNYYLAKQLGNSAYNTTFGTSYAGMLADGMLGYQSISQLNKTTTGVPYYDLALAKEYWSKVNFAEYGITDTSSGYMFNGKPLVIPIVISTGDPTDLAGATSWGGALSSFITGATFPVVPEPFPTIIGFKVPGQNPMPIYFLGWGPDYPYPTDYMNPMALPENATNYPGSNAFTEYYFNATGHYNQAANMTKMIDYYNNATQASITSVAVSNFQKMNEMLINETFYVYLYQRYAQLVMSKSVNGNDIVNYQENVIGAGTQIFYNLMALNTTTA